MARSKGEWECAKFERYLKEGRGQGEGKNYVPWIQIHDFPSQGRSHRILGWKTGREHHLLSDLEKKTFYLFEWSDIVTDIREQYPLLNLDLAMSIADEMNFKYPEDSKHKTPYILTTDFLLTVEKEGKKTQVARTVKLAKYLEKKSVVEKLELERRYYLQQNIDWGIITEKGISPIFANNIGWIHSSYHLEPSIDAELPELYPIANILLEVKCYQGRKNIYKLLMTPEKWM